MRSLTPEQQRAQLLEWHASQRCTRVRIIAPLATSTCTACLTHDGDILPLLKAMMGERLPTPGCTCADGCRCRYGPVSDAADGSLSDDLEAERTARRTAILRQRGRR